MISIIEARRGGDGRVETRVMAQGEGRWLLRVQHRAGSLEAAVGPPGAATCCSAPAS